ncbi:YjdF family protein [uncultured Faecalibaculum sp.]|uniref:YjdF family protein n=1 Tax=uncultured Faecalibaculum sp. TaxID=1729681 RepID=UPI0025E0C45A|nr:YjdF family protein [uncultured Faecalibaculum sp.]
MNKVSVKLTVFFEDPFWVGVIEVVCEGRLSACKLTFRGNPSDCEIYEYLRDHCTRLQFTPDVPTAEKSIHLNPKRKQREARKQMQKRGTGTKSQQALKLQQEMYKTERVAVSREQKKAEEKRKFELKQQKRKEKHRGR